MLRKLKQPMTLQNPLQRHIQPDDTGRPSAVWCIWVALPEPPWRSKSPSLWWSGEIHRHRRRHYCESKIFAPMTRRLERQHPDKPAQKKKTTCTRTGNQKRQERRTRVTNTHRAPFFCHNPFSPSLLLLSLLLLSFPPLSNRACHLAIGGSHVVLLFSPFVSAGDGVIEGAAVGAMVGGPVVGAGVMLMSLSATVGAMVGAAVGAAVGAVVAVTASRSSITPSPDGPPTHRFLLVADLIFPHVSNVFGKTKTTKNRAKEGGGRGQQGARVGVTQIGKVTKAGGRVGWLPDRQRMRCDLGDRSTRFFRRRGERPLTERRKKREKRRSM